MGCRAADAGITRPAAARPGRCRYPHSGKRAVEPQADVPDVGDLGLVRRWPARGVEEIRTALFPNGTAVRLKLDTTAAQQTRQSAPTAAGTTTHAVDRFITSDNCLACHNGMRTATGENVSIGADWRSSMMVNAGRDRHGMAGVRREVAGHPIVGGNFFMLRMLNTHPDELGVIAPSTELDRAELSGATLGVDVAAQNRSGHKLPTGYPSRRVWLHVTVGDGGGCVVFESEAVDAKGQIAGNDGDRAAAAFEPHYTEVTSADQVQVYESVMADSAGKPTTGHSESTPTCASSPLPTAGRRTSRSTRLPRPSAFMRFTTLGDSCTSGATISRQATVASMILPSLS